MDIEKLISIFIDESRENIYLLNKKLLELKNDPENTETFSEIFRTIHTLKSMAKTVGFEEIARLSHNMETLLENTGKQHSLIEKNTINLLFQCSDKMLELVDQIAKTATDKDCPGVDKYISSLQELIQDKEYKKNAVGVNNLLNTDFSANDKSFAVNKRIITSAQNMNIKSIELDNIINLLTELLIKSKKEFYFVENKKKNIFIQSTIITIEEILNKALILRNISISQVFNRFPKFVMELSAELGKDLSFTAENNNVELDSQSANEIAEILVHLIKNAVDHGIETCEERILAGKKAKGALILKALKKNKNLLIKVIDDGAGIYSEKIAQKAIEKGLIDEKKLSGLSENDFFEFLYKPGFSLKEKVTDVSGRGIGMDVVRSKVNELGGKIKIKSEKGNGTEFIIKIPIDAMKINCMFVKIKNEIYGLPVNYIEKITNITPDQIESSNKIILIDKQTISFKKPADLSGLNSSFKSLHVLWIKSQKNSVGIIIDEAFGQKEIFADEISFIDKKFIIGSTKYNEREKAFILNINSIIE